MIKTVLVHLRGTKADTATLAAAVQFAQPFGAHLECLHIRPDLGSLISRAAIPDADDDTETIGKMLRDLQKESSAMAGRAKDVFSAFSSGLVRGEFPPGPSTSNAAFRETIGKEIEQLVRQCRYHDLIVTKAGYDAEGGLSAGDLGRLIIQAGRPILLVPSSFVSPINTVVIAWKDAAEAARAVSAAMPVLERARKIVVVTAGENDDETSDAGSVVKQLQWHGLNADSHRVEPRDREAHDAVLEVARVANADLLVAGAYGHNRLSETIFGGFTQGLLDDASLPVLLLH